MTFQIPHGVKYTDMCIYIDEHIYTEDCDKELVYRYLYHIVYMLADKASLFNKHYYYDYFALFGATRLYLRLTNPKQFVLVDGVPKLEKITSILNYAKKTLYPMKVDFEQQEYCQSGPKSPSELSSPNYSSIIRESVNALYLSEFQMVLHDIPKTCKSFLKSIPYPYRSAEWLNIYTSVLLTLLNWMTLRRKSKDRIAHLGSTNRLKDSHIDAMFKIEDTSTAVLFHLDPSFNDYIVVLARQLRRTIGKDLSEIINTSAHIDVCDVVYGSEYDEYKD